MNDNKCLSFDLLSSWLWGQSDALPDSTVPRHRPHTGPLPTVPAGYCRNRSGTTASLFLYLKPIIHGIYNRDRTTQNIACITFRTHWFKISKFWTNLNFKVKEAFWKNKNLNYLNRTFWVHIITFVWVDTLPFHYKQYLRDSSSPRGRAGHSE